MSRGISQQQRDILRRDRAPCSLADGADQHVRQRDGEDHQQHPDPG
jgi:hypothetical protein